MVTSVTVVELRPMLPSRTRALRSATPAVMDVTDVLADLRADLVAEQQTLDDIVASLDATQWQLSTPSPGWTIADQIGHLTYFDGTAALAVVDPPAFRRSR